MAFTSSGDPRKFFITGESYAGHYGPALAKRIFDGNDEGNPSINLKGMLLGNPLLPDYRKVFLFDAETLAAQGIIPRTMSDEFHEYCQNVDEWGFGQSLGVTTRTN
jgi:carboxypeptidase C (cathepsin A)